MRTTRFFISAALVALVACADNDAADDDAAEEAAPPAAAPAPAPAPATPAMTDPEIANIAVTANTLDAEGGQTAKGKASNAEVKQFAQTMVTDHTKANEEANALAQRLNLTPADNANSQQMKADHERAKSELATKSGADFDRAYIAHEVTMHQNVLNALDQQLIPNAQNAELKALLEKARTMVQSHLQMAQQIQTKLGAAQ
jgi:putative membrane protein